jgi:anti-sigma regulatory factor (Ser/Thr protein kinase)
VTSSTGAAALHAALLYGSAGELTAAAVPFLADGLAAGETAVLACRPDHDALLAEALGDGDRVLVLARDEVYTGSAHAVASYRRLVRRRLAAGSAGVRVVAEIPFGRHPPGWGEWHRYEAILNVALAPLPMSSVCAYDRRAIPDPVRDGIVETHPALLTPAGPVPNDRYEDPATVLRRISAPPVDRVQDVPPALDLTDLADGTRLTELRAHVTAALDGPSGQEQLRGRFAVAVAEVLGNAFRHGRPPVAVRLWTTPTRLECLVIDDGDGFDNPLAGFAAPGIGSPPAGAGLWLVRQACDGLEVFRTPTGFAVRLTTVLPGTGSTSARGPSPAESTAARAERARVDARELIRRLHEEPQGRRRSGR